MTLNREDQIIIDLFREDNEPEILSTLERLTVAEWDGVIRRSFEHSVSPLLYWHLKKLWTSVSVPADVQGRLRQIYIDTVTLNIRLYHELSKVLGILKDNGIPVIVLKGAHLGELVYGDIGLRTLSDADLLLKKEDLARGQKSLMKAGCYLQSGQLILDLHWSIDLSIADFNIDIEEVWKRAQPGVIAGTEVLVLSREDLLLNICLHLSSVHLFQFGGLRALCDIREMVNKYSDQIAWEKVKELAGQWGALKAVYLVLLLAKDLLGARIPDEIITNMRPAEFELRVRAWAVDQIFNETENRPVLSQNFWQLLRSHSLREQVSLLRKLLLPSPAFISQKYPGVFRSAKSYLYYPVRLKRRSMPFIKTLWGMLTRNKETVQFAKTECRNAEMREWLFQRGKCEFGRGK